MAARTTRKRLPGSSRVVVEGQIPAKAAPFARTASVDNPTAFFVSAFRDALIAEGKVIPDNSLVMGMPGKVVRVLDAEAMARLPKAAEGYVLNWQRFAKGLERL